MSVRHFVPNTSEIETTILFNHRDQNYDSDGEMEIPERSLDVFTQRIRLLGAEKGHDIDRTEFKKARWFVLNNCKGISNYLE